MSKTQNEFGTFDEGQWKGSIGNFHQSQELKLGPGQRKPRTYNMNSSKFGEIFLEFNTMRSFLEMKVILKYLKKLLIMSKKIFKDFGNAKSSTQLHGLT